MKIMLLISIRNSYVYLIRYSVIPPLDHIKLRTYSYYRQVLILPVFVDVAKNINLVVSKHNTIMYGILEL